MSATAIGELEPRRRATMAGEILTVVTYESPWVRTDAEVGDGTGVVVLRFMGRAHVPGLAAGRHIVAEGTPAVHGDALVVHNPLYQFVAG